MMNDDDGDIIEIDDNDFEQGTPIAAPESQLSWFLAPHIIPSTVELECKVHRKKALVIND